MVSIIVLLAILIPALYVIKAFYTLRRNVSVAKQTGLRYVVLPVALYNRLWQIIQPLCLPWLERLPRSWTEPWLTFLRSEWPYIDGYEPFRKVGADTFFLVSPGRSIVWTCDPDVITQVASRRLDFPKPPEHYDILNVYGINVVSAEGALWRQHRKVVAPSFSEKTNELAWAQTLNVAQDMLKGWVGDRGEGTVYDLGSNTFRLTLHVISWAAFGVRLRWSTKSKPASDTSKELSQQDGTGNDDELPPGHVLGFEDALQKLLANLVWIMLLPHALLKRSPLKMHKRAWLAYQEWHQHMIDVFERKKKEMREGRTESGSDVVGALIRASDNGEENDVSPAKSGAKPTGQGFSEEELLGNAFVIALAGHETTANAVHFSLLYLAMYPSSQERLQEDLDKLLGDKPISEWSYEEDFPKLFNGMPGAVMNETLRLIPAVIALSKKTKSQPQSLLVDGRTVTIPPGCYITFDICGGSRHPKYWPTDPNIADDIDQFRPERWLLKDNATQPSFKPKQNRISTSPEEEEDYLRTAPEHANTNLFRPVRGSYIPFSEGPRACLGRKLAQAEITAVLAALLRHHSVELAVHDYATDEEIEQMPVGGEERRKIWLKARNRAEWLLKYGMSSIVSLQMRVGNVPLRVVKRGDERFWGFDERGKSLNRGGGLGEGNGEVKQNGKL